MASSKEFVFGATRIYYRSMAGYSVFLVSGLSPDRQKRAPQVHGNRPILHCVYPE